MLRSRALTFGSTLILVTLLLPLQPSAGGEAGGVLDRVRQQGDPWRLVENGQPATDLVLVGPAAESELVRDAAQWIVGFVERSTKVRLPVAGKEALTADRRHLVALVSKTPPPGMPTADVGPEGFILQRLSSSEQGDRLVCWSPAELGCRYGLIEILRSLRTSGKLAQTDLVRVIDRPQFPMRICYVNFAEHLQNAYNPNLLFDVPVNRWTPADWERFIDMVSAFRYNIFEFWLVPTLFSPDALRGGKIQRDFADTINRVIAYGKRRGVAVHPIQAVNTVGADWHYHCPNVPAERSEILALWDHWSRAIQGNQYIGFFPGDPGGCTKNGCTAQTYVDLCLELSKIVRKNNPTVDIEVGTWGDPMAGWGASLWTGKPDRAEQAMSYFLAKLPEFPPGTFTSINLGFSPDCHPNTHGGDGRPYAKKAAKLIPVLTWDYSVSEGEGTVSPRCRVRRMLDRRREELALGCYSGGICYTMAPKLQCLSLFCSAEAWWNPQRTPESVLADYGRLVFGDDLAEIGPLLEEFEIVPDWGYYAPFPYSPTRLQTSMAKLLPLVEKIDAQSQPRLPLASTMAEYRKSLLFFANLFGRLAEVAVTLDELTRAAKASGKLPASSKDSVSLDEAEAILAEPGDFPQRQRFQETTALLRRLDVRGMTKQYWDTVYGIYDVIPHPTDPRAQGATAALFNRFHCELAMAYPASPIAQPLRDTQKPFVLVQLGRPGGIKGWKTSGWTLHGEDGGESWSASFAEPGVLARDDFQDRGYRWLVVRLTEGPQGGRKTITLNGKQIGQFVRTGPPVGVKKEWWVTRCYPIPAGLLVSGPVEIRFSDPGVAIAAVALSVEPIPDSNP